MREIFHKRSYLLTSSAVRAPILTGVLSLDKEASIINIIQYKNPLSLLIAVQPVVYQLEYIGLWILPSRDLDAICDILKALLKPGGIACMDLEHLCLRQAFLSLIGVFDSELRLALQQLAIYTH